MLKKGRFRDNVQLFVLCLPVIVVLFLFQYLPMGGVVLAFKNYQPLKGIWGSTWTGLSNFKFFFDSQLAWDVTRNTVLYNLAFIILTPVFAVGVSILLNEIGSKFSVKLYQTVFFLPYFLSWVVISIMAYAFLNDQRGIINGVLRAIPGFHPVAWYSTPGAWPFILVFVGLWASVGYNSIIYYASLVGIDPDLYEAAAMDGAGRWRRIWSITIPMLYPVIAVLTILALGRIFFSDFGLYYQVTLQSGILLPTVDVINYFTYRALEQLNDVGMGAAVGLYQSVVGLVLVVVANVIVRRMSDGEYGIF